MAVVFPMACNYQKNLKLIIIKVVNTIFSQYLYSEVNRKERQMASRCGVVWLTANFEVVVFEKLGG